jgi:pyridoxine kinase
MTTILSIQSQVANATVGNSVAAFAIQRLGARVIALPTTQFGRRPDRADAASGPGGGPVPAEVLLSLLDAITADGALDQVDAVLTGYIANADQASVARMAVERVRARRPRALIVCDPVMGDRAKGLYVRADVATAIKENLAIHADLITPNAFEMGQLAEEPADSLNALYACAMRFGKPAAITSAALPGNDGILYVARTGAWHVQTPKLDHPAKGAGDLLAALLTTRRAQGQSLVVALEAAVGAVHDVIVRSMLERSDHLCVVEAQEKLEFPETWPTARQFKPE